MRQDIVRQVHKILMKDKKTVSVAESCTGGILSSLLTQMSGSSKYFIFGAVVYSNASKINFLGISCQLIRQKGAVSKEVACKLSQNVAKLNGTDFGIGITGIAGPTGATLHKPKGTVFIAVSSRKRQFCQKFHFSGNRVMVRKKAALKALEILKIMLLN